MRPARSTGRRVVAFVHGGYAEYAVAAAGLVTEVPPGVDLAESTAFLVQGVTAWQLLRDCCRLRRTVYQRLRDSAPGPYDSAATEQAIRVVEENLPRRISS